MSNKNIIKVVLSLLVMGLLSLITYEVLHIYGTASKYKERLPDIGRNIHAGIDQKNVRKIKFRHLIELEGWAYINNYNAESQTVYIVLLSEKEHYIFGTQKVLRNDLPSALNDPTNSVENAGFSTLIDMSNVEEGTYSIGYYIKNEDQEELSLSGTLVKNNNKEITFEDKMNQLQKLKIEESNTDITVNIEEIVIGEEETRVKGWGYLDNVSSKGSEIFILLQGENETLIYDTQSLIRKDVSNYFNGGNELDYSGFIFRIKNRDLIGRYKVGIYITNEQLSGLFWSRESIGE